MNKYGAVLDDFGLETMLDKLMDDFVRPLSRGNILSLIKDVCGYKNMVIYGKGLI